MNPKPKPKPTPRVICERAGKYNSCRDCEHAQPHLPEPTWTETTCHRSKSECQAAQNPLACLPIPNQTLLASDLLTEKAIQTASSRYTSPDEKEAFILGYMLGYRAAESKLP